MSWYNYIIIIEKMYFYEYLLNILIFNAKEWLSDGPLQLWKKLICDFFCNNYVYQWSFVMRSFFYIFLKEGKLTIPALRTALQTGLEPVLRHTENHEKYKINTSFVSPSLLLLWLTILVLTAYFFYLNIRGKLSLIRSDR